MGKVELLKQLTSKQLQELCKQYNLKGFAGLKQNELAKFVAENTPLKEEEIEQLVRKYQEDALLSKIKDAQDFFMAKQVEVIYAEKGNVKAKVGGYEVTLHDLGSDNFEYSCDQRCQDWLYQVKKGR